MATKPYSEMISYAPAALSGKAGGVPGLEYIEFRGELERPIISFLTRKGFGSDGYSLLEIKESAAALAQLFGLPPALPVFCRHAGNLRGFSVIRAPDSSSRDHIPVTVHGWTPPDAPDKPRLMVTEPCGVDACHGSGAHGLPGPTIFATMVHEHAHRLAAEFPALVNWDREPWSINRQCSEGVQDFAREVSAKSCPGWLSLGKYEDLAAACRKAAGY